MVDISLMDGFESEVVFTGESSLRESATIVSCSGGDRLCFSTVGEGYLRAWPDP